MLNKRTAKNSNTFFSLNKARSRYFKRKYKFRKSICSHTCVHIWLEFLINYVCFLFIYWCQNEGKKTVLGIVCSTHLYDSSSSSCTSTKLVWPAVCRKLRCQIQHLLYRHHRRSLTRHTLCQVVLWALILKVFRFFFSLITSMLSTALNWTLKVAFCDFYISDLRAKITATLSFVCSLNFNPTEFKSV